MDVDGQIIGGQKVRGFHPRAIDLVEALRQDIAEYLVATRYSVRLLFPRQDGAPWRSHDWKNWGRRVWHPAREAAGIERLPPYVTCGTRSRR
jgi:hypothetical protein